MVHSRVTKSMQNKQMNQRVKTVLRNDNRMIHRLDEFPPDPISCTLRRVGPGSAAACLGLLRLAAQVESAPVPFGTGCGRHLLSPWPGHRHTAGASHLYPLEVRGASHPDLGVWSKNRCCAFALARLPVCARPSCGGVTLRLGGDYGDQP